MDKQKEYSVTKEIGIVLLIGLVLGLISLVISIGLVEFFKR